MMSKLNDLALHLSIMLQHYLTNTPSLFCQKKLLQASCDLYKEAVKNSTLEPDRYLVLIDDALTVHLDEVQMSEEQGKELDAFNRKITDLDDPAFLPAFHALNLVYHRLKNKKSVVTLEETRDQITNENYRDDNDININEFMMI